MSKERIARQTLAIILAGGQGRRLDALTRHRCKPALPFGGRYRSIDFTLSNCINSGITRIGVATQYHSQPLIQHIQQGWQFLCRERGECLELWAAEQRDEARWYAGTADAVYQNLVAVARHRPRHVIVLAADHIYRMDYAAMVVRHHDSGADVTVACQSVPSGQADQFGILSVKRHEIVDFQEKPTGIRPGSDVLASMGVYVFNTDFLCRLLEEDAADSASTHDFGHDLIPACVARRAVCARAYRFRDPATGGPGYWRDIGTVDGYWAANMDLLSGDCGLDLYDSGWPIWAIPDRSAPSRLGAWPDGAATQISQAIVAGGCRLDGATVRRSIVSGDVQVGKGSIVEDSLLLPGARIGAYCQVRRSIIDEGVELADGTSVGEQARPAAHYCAVSPGGVTVVTGRPDAGATEPRRKELRAAGVLKRQERVQRPQQPYRETPLPHSAMQ